MPDELSPVNYQLNPDGSITSLEWQQVDLAGYAGPPDLAITALTEATAQDVVTMNSSITVPAHRRIKAAFFVPAWKPSTGGQRLVFTLWDDLNSVGLGLIGSQTATNAVDTGPIYIETFDTGAGGNVPVAFQWTVRAFVSTGTATLRGGNGFSTGLYQPIALRTYIK